MKHYVARHVIACLVRFWGRRELSILYLNGQTKDEGYNRDNDRRRSGFKVRTAGIRDCLVTKPGMKYIYIQLLRYLYIYFFFSIRFRVLTFDFGNREIVRIAIVRLCFVFFSSKLIRVKTKHELYCRLTKNRIVYTLFFFAPAKTVREYVIMWNLYYAYLKHRSGEVGIL